MSEGFCFLAGVDVDGPAETVTLWPNSESVAGVMSASTEVHLFGAPTCTFLGQPPSHCES